MLYCVPQLVRLHIHMNAEHMKRLLTFYTSAKLQKSMHVCVYTCIHTYIMLKYWLFEMFRLFMQYLTVEIKTDTHSLHGLPAHLTRTEFYSFRDDRGECN